MQSQVEQQQRPNLKIVNFLFPGEDPDLAEVGEGYSLPRTWCRGEGEKQKR